MTGVVSDTHAAIWFLGKAPELSAIARSAMTGAVSSGGSIVVASITLIEVTYLIEKGRIPPTVLDDLKKAIDDPSSGLVLAPLDREICNTLWQVPRDQVPDMPDRIIAATALHLNLPLISRDRKIKAFAVTTIW